MPEAGFEPLLELEPRAVQAALHRRKREFEHPRDLAAGQFLDIPEQQNGAGCGIEFREGRVQRSSKLCPRCRIVGRKYGRRD